MELNKDNEGLEKRFPPTTLKGSGFTRSYMNYLQEDTTVPRDLEVVAVEKINGFMACLSVHEGQFVVSTTGTLDSIYAKWAKEMILGGLPTSEYSKLLDFVSTNNISLMFEVVHEDDPHIVKEDIGVYLIGQRCNVLFSELGSEARLDDISFRYSLHWKRPQYFTMRFSDVLKQLDDCEGEGFMIRNAQTNEVLCKLKSPYYKGKKLLMRANAASVQEMYRNPQVFFTNKGLSDRFNSVVQAIVSHHTVSEWTATEEQARRTFIEGVLEGAIVPFACAPTLAEVRSASDAVQSNSDADSNTLFLLRGLPNASKSSTARQFVRLMGGDKAAHFEADSYFVQPDGSYAFDAAQLGQAHAQCVAQVTDAMRAGTAAVFVSNTLTPDKEIATYEALAAQHGYRVVSLIVENRHAGGDNGHNVPADTMQKMRDRFSICLGDC